MFLEVWLVNKAEYAPICMTGLIGYLISSWLG
jgi:hypothetical protein